MGHQSLYRRYRSQTFAEIKGQPVVTNALRTAVAQGRHGHAYLFSGPRGTGKTSTARVLAKALNCENPTNGEPDGTCASCKDIESGRSFDLHELDAASNNKVDDIRELINRVALGSPGRTKVYILDEVHMLSSGAENALLKTLEEPPDHVVFVLATTEPQKVVPTIRSRTQHFRFQLLPAAELEAHLRWVIADAGLDVDDEGIAWALKTGGGSARDALSALDLVVASGGAPETTNTGADLCRAVAQRDPAAAIAVLHKGLEIGSEPRIMGEDMLAELRSAFLASMNAPLPHLNDAAADRAHELAQALGPAAITRSMEKVGAALVEVRQAPDPRVPIEIALLQLARADGDDTAALLQRIERLEQRMEELAAGGGRTPAPSAKQPAEKLPGRDVSPAVGAPPPPSGRASAVRNAITERESEDSARSAPPRSAPPFRTDAERSSPESSSVRPDNDDAELVGSFTLSEVIEQLPGVLEGLAQKVRARFRQGQPIEVQDGVVTFAYPNQLPADRAIDVKAELERAMSAQFKCPVRVEVIVDRSKTGGPPPRRTPRQSAPAASDSEDEIGPLSELKDADDSSNTMVDRLTAAFPGATLIDPPPSNK